MKKVKILAALAATMAVGATCAFAANPFADVPTDSWAYKSVVTLANSGILQGVDGTHFQGNRNITRYEAAEITAKAMAHADRANAQQRAIINKLAHEFAGELNNLGVRVANLEDQVGTVKFSGIFKAEYNYKGAQKTEIDTANYQTFLVAKKVKKTPVWKAAADIPQPNLLERTSVTRAAAAANSRDAAVKKITGDDSYSYTAQLTATAKVSDKTKAVVGFKYKGEFVKNGDADKAYAHVNVANVQTEVADRVSVLAGRYNLTLGQGYIYDDTVDGAEVQYGGKKVELSAGYAKLKADYPTYKVGYVQAKAAVCDRVAVGAYFGNVMTGEPNLRTQVYGASVQAKVSDQVKALVSYEKYKEYKTNTHETKSKPASWYGKVTYGNADFETPKSWDIWVDYLQADDFAMVNGATWRSGNLQKDVKSWGAGVEYVFAKHAKFQLQQSFASKKKSDIKVINTKLGEQTKAQVVFVF